MNDSRIVIAVVRGRRDEAQVYIAKQWDCEGCGFGWRVALNTAEPTPFPPVANADEAMEQMKECEWGADVELLQLFLVPANPCAPGACSDRLTHE